MIYLTLYISECLKKLQRCPSKNEAQKSLATLAVSGFDIPGDPNFPLNGFMIKPSNRGEAGQCTQLHIYHLLTVISHTVWSQLCIIIIVNPVRILAESLIINN
jgi:hypothetical protein